jgi:hypothetical protein
LKPISWRVERAWLPPNCERIESGQPRPRSDSEPRLKTRVERVLPRTLEDAISLAVNFKTFPEGTNYAAGKVLNVAAKNIVVNIEDSNYQKIAN